MSSYCWIVQQVSPEHALSALLLGARSGSRASLLFSVASVRLTAELALAANPAVRLPFELDTKPTLAPESAVEPDSPRCCGGSMTTTLLLPLLEWLPLAGPLPLKLYACGPGLEAEVAFCAGTVRKSSSGVTDPPMASLKAVAGCSLLGNGPCGNSKAELRAVLAAAHLFYDSCQLASSTPRWQGGSSQKQKLSSR